MKEPPVRFQTSRVLQTMVPTIHFRQWCNPCFGAPQNLWQTLTRTRRNHIFGDWGIGKNLARRFVPWNKDKKDWSLFQVASEQGGPKTFNGKSVPADSKTGRIEGERFVASLHHRRSTQTSKKMRGFHHFMLNPWTGVGWHSELKSWGAVPNKKNNQNEALVLTSLKLYTLYTIYFFGYFILKKHRFF